MSAIHAVAFIGSSLVGRNAQQGLANSLGLGTLRHGTNAINWLSIHILGTIPFFGENRTGGDYNYMQRIQNKDNTFFTYAHPTDTEAINDYSDEKLSPTKWTRWLPKEYEYRSNQNMLRAVYLPGIITAPVSLFLSIVIPSVKVYFPDGYMKNKEGDFKRDRDEYYSYYTDKWITPFSIGTVGVVWQSLTYKTPLRMIENPDRVITGVAQLALSATAFGLLTVYFPAFATTYQVSLVAGLALGMI